MEILVWIGAALTLAGLAGLGWCVRLALRVRGQGLDDAGQRAALQRMVTLNLAALAMSALGLGAVVVGIVLG